MKWSYTKSKIFLNCQRRWFFNEYIASWNAKDKFRKEAYILKQLYSIYAWRGKIVDDVIENMIVPELISHQIPKLSEVKNYAIDLMEKQYEFAINKNYRSGITKKNAGNSFCALKEIEFNNNISNEEYSKIQNDILYSLKNLVKSNLIRDIAENSIKIVAQKRINHNFDDVNVICIPDLIVLYEHLPALIIDWKVHEYANTEARSQLLTYAYIYYNSKYDENIRNLSRIEDTRLIEYQLLKDYKWEYPIEPEDILEIEDYIFTTSTQMKKLINGRGYNKLELSQFNTAKAPRFCNNCNYKKLCWKKLETQKTLWDF